MNHYFVTVEADAVVLIDATQEHRVASAGELDAFLGPQPSPFSLLCSSTVDFPEESTDDPGVLAAVARLKARCA